MPSSKGLTSKKSLLGKLECSFCHQRRGANLKGFPNHWWACEKKHLLTLQKMDYEKHMETLPNPTCKYHFISATEYFWVWLNTLLSNCNIYWFRSQFKTLGAVWTYRWVIFFFVNFIAWLNYSLIELDIWDDNMTTTFFNNHSTGMYELLQLLMFN